MNVPLEERIHRMQQYICEKLEQEYSLPSNVSKAVMPSMFIKTEVPEHSVAENMTHNILDKTPKMEKIEDPNNGIMLVV